MKLRSGRAESLPSVGARAGVPGRENGRRRRRAGSRRASSGSSSWTTARRTGREPKRRRRGPRSCGCRRTAERGRRCGRVLRGSWRAMRPTSPSWTPTRSTTRPTCRGCWRPPARATRFVIGSRMADLDAIPSYRFRTNEIGSEVLSRMAGHRRRGRAVRLSRRRGGRPAQARPERAGVHHRDGDPAEGVAPRAPVPARAGPGDLRRRFALPAVSGHVDHFVGGGVLQSVRDGLTGVEGGPCTRPAPADRDRRGGRRTSSAPRPRESVRVRGARRYNPRTCPSPTSPPSASRAARRGC